jgi:hypothetical protein
MELTYVRSYWWAGALLAFMLLFYIPSYSNGFVCDDFQFLERINFTSATLYFTRSWGYGNEYRPIVPLSYALDSFLSHTNPVGYHLTNTLLHAANAILIIAIAMRTGVRRSASILAGFIYAIDPVAHEAVLWISGRPVVMGAFFVLACCYFFLKATSDVAHSALCWFAAYGSFLLGLGTYEVAIVTPLLCAILCFLAGKPRAKYGFHVAVCMIIALGYALAWNVFFNFHITRFPVEHSVVGALSSMGQAWTHAFHGSLSPAGGIAFAALLVSFLRKAQGRIIVVAAAAWAFCAYLPFFIVHGYADRFAYLSSASLAVLLALALLEFTGQSLRAQIGLVVLLLSYFATGMQHRITTWKEAGDIAQAITDDIKQAMPVFPRDKQLVLLNVPAMHKQAYVYMPGLDLDRALSRRYEGAPVSFFTTLSSAERNAIIFEYSNGHMRRRN